MSITVAIEHVTTYEFDRAVSLGPHVVRLRPAPHSKTPITAYSLRVDPAQHFLNWQQDPFGNYEARLVFPEKSRRLEVVVDVVAEMGSINPFDFFLEEEAEELPWEYAPELAHDLAPYLVKDDVGPDVAAWIADVDRTPRRTIDFLVELNQRLADDVEYTIRMEPGVQTPQETLERGIGSCRDSAWMLVTACRHLGLAARFVSGYLVQLVADEPPLDGPAGPTEDFTDLHAWTEVFLPGAGWVGLDPTSGLFAAEGHIPLAATPSPDTAAPIAGTLDECEVEFSFANNVTRIAEEPRVTLPYDEAEWQAIDELGRRVDERLRLGDVRLTMGGEPTFVSIDDMQSPEWNTLADGWTKRRKATELMARLTDRFAPTGLVHHGQGKWYPGEPLPRWQQTLLWRLDGEPVWTDRKLQADATSPGSTPREAAEEFVAALTDRLGIEPGTALPAWEDPIHDLWLEAQLPYGPAPTDDVDPTDPALFDEWSRRTLASRLESRIGVPTGYVLPLHRGYGRPGWTTSTWKTRRDHLFLVPGDSPLGYRLPIQSLSWADPPPEYLPSQFATLRPLPRFRPFAVGAPGAGTADGAVLTGGPPTALCTEVRDGTLHVFLPPLGDTGALLELVAAIEASAAEIGAPVAIEGYPFPTDPRLGRLAVTPDPGVIEVNVPPASDWTELRTIVEGVYADARATRLGTEKFDLDGAHNGTGGGNHMTIGAAAAPDSPLLRRPSLLRSLLTYWQHHPALSYVFSGRFIGPSSQAPRVDEGRDDSLFELETAFDELARHGDGGPPWLVDRLLRNLLVDQTGNTHRAEFCIDKLFSPEGERGRLGLLELRAFEMPPHPRMAMVQALLVRSIIARCWEDPYQGPLARWGTALQDRFMLPWYLERDLRDVVTDLVDHGFDLDEGWFDPFLSFRFPRHGSVTVDGVGLELRGAIEPWHVLGEEATGSGMARYVDSSVERLQLLATGYVGERYAVTCNGVEVPLQETDVNGTFVAGIRYKAWQPPSGLHPTIGIDSPLTFDLIDTWTGRAVGGCRYHVVHPGGLSHEQYPVNAAVAETRRRARFEPLGHSPGATAPVAIRPADHREHPTTLDLRRITPR